MTQGRALRVLAALSLIAAGSLPLGWAGPVEARAMKAASVPALLQDLDAAQPGDEITIAPGTYEMPPLRLRQSGAAGQPIILRAAALGSVELRSRATEFIKVSGSDWVFENLDIAGICADDTDCEHAFHIVSGADRIVIRHNRIRDYNAHIKGNGEGGRFPNDVLIEGNWLFDTHHRHTDNPIAPIDVVGGQRWIVRGNLIADYGKTIDHPAVVNDDFGYALFFKGNSSSTLIERNVVACSMLLPPLSYTRGISLGGSATGPQFCEGDCNADENHDSTLRNNVVLDCPMEDGIYLWRAKSSRVLANTLIGTYGIEARGKDSSAAILDNLVDGGIVASEGATIEASDNVTAGPADLPLSRYFADARDGKLSLRPGTHFDLQVPTLSDVSDDLCGHQRPQDASVPGAIQYGGASCDVAEKLLADYRAYAAKLRGAKP
jgi:hypothetical protein